MKNNQNTEHWYRQLSKEKLLDKTRFIIQPIYSYENEDGNRVYDIEEMTREFNNRLEQLESEVE